MTEEIEEYPVSWSSLRYWQECKQLAYLMGQRRKNPVSDIRNFFHGNVVDRIMRNWLCLDNPQLGTMAGMVDEYMELCEQEAKEREDGRLKWRHLADKEDVRTFCVELVNRLEPILFEEVLPFDFEPAKRFAVPITATTLEGRKFRILLKGEFDLLVRNPQTDLFRVWDLKATKDNSYWRKTMGQLIFYDLSVCAMFQSFPEQSGLIQPMCDERVKRFSFSDDDRQTMLSQIVRMVESQANGDFSPKESTSGCSYCVVRHGCPRFKPKKDSSGLVRVGFNG